MAIGRREIAVDQDYEFTLKFYTNGLQEVPAAATWTIYDKDETEIATGAGSILEGVGDVLFTFAEADNETIAKNFKLVCTWTDSSGAERYHYELFDVVAVPLINQCSDEVLFDKITELRKTVEGKLYRTTEAGGTNELRSLQLVEDTRDYEGGYLEIFFEQTDTQHTARILSYDRSSGSCIFSPEYTAEIGADLTFRIRPSFQRKIDDAFERQVKRDIRNRYGLASRIIDGNLVTNLVAYKTLEIYCLSQIETDGDKWAIRHEAYKKLYLDELASLQEASDQDDDGSISDGEDKNRKTLYTIEAVR